jgi:capsular polysaccharide biosynthesis protein
MHSAQTAKQITNIIDRSFSTLMEFNSTNLFILMYQWRKPLIIIPVVAAVLAAVFSAPVFITPLYKSTVILFPSTTNSLSKALLPQQSGFSNEDFLEFGDEQQAEQLLQILNSGEIRDSVIQAFDLMKHYKIKDNTKFKRTKLFKTYASNISFRRTEFMSVEIEVLDASPDTAAMIANHIALLADKARRRVQHDRARQGLGIIKAEYDRIRSEIAGMQEEITLLRYKGVHDYEAQSAVLSEQLAVAMMSNPNSRATIDLQNKLDTLAKYGGMYVSLRDELSLLKEEEIKMKIKYEQTKVDVEQEMPTTFKVDNAFPAERKTYPVRTLIVLIAAVAAFMFALVVILISNSIREASSKES